MDTPLTGGAWFLLIAGAVCAVIGLWAILSRDGYPSLIRAIGGPAAGERESARIPRLLFAGGICLFVVGASQLIPYPHGERPYAVVILTVVLHPLGGLAIAAVMFWVALLRRFRG